ncbi:hypothetical protein D3C77_423990 [compost metagenome]
MNSKGYLYAAEMLDLLVTVVNKEKWNDVLIPELGSLGRLFAHMIRVRDVYRKSLITGRVILPGTPVPKGIDLVDELIRSRNELADAIVKTQVERVYWSDDYFVPPSELVSMAIQHEAIHQGQWYVALKQLGIPIPEQWKSDWHLF